MAQFKVFKRQEVNTEKKNQDGDNILHKAFSFDDFDQVLPFARALKLDLIPLLESKNNNGKTFMDVAKEKGVEKQAIEVQEGLKRIAKNQQAHTRMQDYIKQSRQPQK